MNNPGFSPWARSGVVQRLRARIVGVAIASVGGSGCARPADDEQSTGEPSFGGAAAEMTSESQSDRATGASSSTADVGYCDVQPIFRDKCLRCHGREPTWGAPLTLASYDDFLETWGSSDEFVYEKVGAAIERNYMPATWLASVDPPVLGLTKSERDLVLRWVERGAPRGEAATCSDSFDD